MTEPNELSEYVATSASEGSPKEGGAFSLAPHEAWKRLQSCLPKQEYWILKLVQAAVLWNAPVLNIYNEPKRCTLSFEPAPNIEITSEQLLDMTTGGRALQHFRLALAGASVDPQFLRVNATWRGPGESFALSWPKESEIEVKKVAAQTSDSHLKIIIEHAGANWFKSTFGTSPLAEEETDLQERARPESLQISWDGEPLNCKEPTTSPLRLAHLAKSKDPESVDIFFHRTLTIAKYYDWAYSQKARRRRGPYGSHPMPATKDEVAWLQDGVVIDRWEDTAVGTASNCVVVLDASGLKVDLSGFQVAFESEAAQRIEQTTPKRVELLQESLHHLPQVLGHEEARRQMKQSVFGRHLLVGLVVWPYLLPGLVEMFRLPKTLKMTLADDLKKASEAIHARLDYLQDSSDRAWQRIERTR